MNVMSFPAASVATSAIHGVQVYSCAYEGRATLYTAEAPRQMADGTLMFQDRFFRSASAAALNARLAALGSLGKNTRRRAWTALAAELSVPYSTLIGANGGGSAWADLA